MSRDIDKQPYSPDEQRVAKFWFDKGIGGGDDPIGALIASHECLVAERNELRAIVRVNGLRWGHTHAEIDAILNQRVERK